MEDCLRRTSERGGSRGFGGRPDCQSSCSGNVSDAHKCESVLHPLSDRKRKEAGDPSQAYRAVCGDAGPRRDHPPARSTITSLVDRRQRPDRRLRVWPSGTPGAVPMVVPRPLGGLDRQTPSGRRHRSTYELMHTPVCWMARGAIVMAVEQLGRWIVATKPRRGGRFSLALDRGSDCDVS